MQRFSQMSTAVGMRNMCWIITVLCGRPGICSINESLCFTGAWHMSWTEQKSFFFGLDTKLRTRTRYLYADQVRIYKKSIDQYFSIHIQIMQAIFNLLYFPKCETKTMFKIEVFIIYSWKRTNLICQKMSRNFFASGKEVVKHSGPSNQYNCGCITSLTHYNCYTIAAIAIFAHFKLSPTSALCIG